MTRGPRNRWLGLLVNLVLLGVALLVAAGLGEITVRILEPNSDDQPLVNSLSEGGRGWELLPNRDVLRQGVSIRTNAFGQRGEEYSHEKPANTFRIIGLGDSYTFGSGVEYEDTYLEVLEDLLSGHGGREYESINFGIEGYNTEQELHYFREEGAALSPDLVLVGYVYNDVVERVEALREGDSDDDSGEDSNRGGGGLTSLVLSLKSKSHLFSTLSPRIGALLRSFGVQGIGEVGEFSAAYGETRPGWRRSCDALLEIQSLASASGAGFGVIVLPAFVSLERDSYPLHPYHQAVTEFCQANGIPVLDIYPSFEGDRAGKYWISINDPHPNAEANRKIAEAIRAFLIEEGLVPAN